MESARRPGRNGGKPSAAGEKDASGRLARVSGQRDEREAAVEEVAAHGWRLAKESASGYYAMYCYCGDHHTNLHKTPSNPDHFKQRVRYMIRLCSKIRDEAEAKARAEAEEEAGRGLHS